MGTPHLNTDQLFCAVTRIVLQPADGVDQCFINARVSAVELRVRLAETIDQAIASIAQG